MAAFCKPLLGEDGAPDACPAGLAELPPTFAPAELAPWAAAPPVLPPTPEDAAAPIDDRAPPAE
ncbi:hypothetical protein, partial [Pseudomonas viridiflava]|uniref:hypothetical protein n=1 Tax=Pseudomonas viridiflava TaxID=33069 RepID=UPI0019D09D11